jgi:hydroxymethylbilane synthase
MKIRLATRGSKLALLQAKEVAAELRKLGNRVELETVKSRGDQDPNTPLERMGVKGIFEKEVDRLILDGSAEAAVHSLKDIPYELERELEVVSVLRRAPAFDAILPVSLENIEYGATVAVGSLRRRSFLKVVRPDLVPAHIRGNMDTRVRKVLGGYARSLIGAEAAFQRLGLHGWHRLSAKMFVPSPGQGAIAVTCSGSAPSELKSQLMRICHRPTFKATLAERRIAHEIGAGCTSPLGVYSDWMANGRARVRVSVTDPTASKKVYIEKKGASPIEMVPSVVESFVTVGGLDFIRAWQRLDNPEVSMSDHTAGGHPL